MWSLSKPCGYVRCASKRHIKLERKSLPLAIYHFLYKASCNWWFFAIFVVQYFFANLTYYSLAKSKKIVYKCRSSCWIFSVLVYYLRSKSKARIAMVKLLKEMLIIEAKDKEFLLVNITRVSQGNGKWMFHLFLKWFDWIVLFIYNDRMAFGRPHQKAKFDKSTTSRIRKLCWNKLHLALPKWFKPNEQW